MLLIVFNSSTYVLHPVCKSIGNDSSHPRLNCHNFCKRIFALMVAGPTSPKESKICNTIDNTVRFITEVHGLYAVTWYWNVSLLGAQLRPRVLISSPPVVILMNSSVSRSNKVGSFDFYLANSKHEDLNIVISFLMARNLSRSS